MYFIKITNMTSAFVFQRPLELKRINTLNIWKICNIKIHFCNSLATKQILRTYILLKYAFA